MAPPTDTTVLDTERSTRLIEFSRACKAAARAVALYPAAHPAIATTLARIAELTSNLHGPLTLTVLPDALLLDGLAPARSDPAVNDLAALLHSHLVGELTIHPGGDVEAWRSFLLLLARAPDAVRTDGGVARLWTTMGGRHVDLREIDYAEVLRERSGGEAAVWERVIASCLQGATMDLSEEAIRTLTEIAGDPARLSELVTALDQRASSGGVPARTAALIRMLRHIAEAVAKTDRDQLEGALRNMAVAIGQCTPDVMLELLTRRPAADEDPANDPHIVGQVVSRMTDQTIASFVSRNVADAGTATDRLAQVFQVLVPDQNRRHTLVGLAHDEAASSPIGQTEGFESMWSNVSSMLTSYSDSSYVSDAYGRELSGARTQAMEVERVSDDPPDRMNAWLATVAPSSVRALDLTLLTDLLRIEEDLNRWRDLLQPVVTQVGDLLLVGDFDAAETLVSVLVREGAAASGQRSSAAADALAQLARGATMRHIVAHLNTIDDAQFEHVKSLCLAIGEPLVQPLAEAISTEERSRPRERLTALLIAFGAVGRQTVERLKHSTNATVRRTAIYLLREFGGSEALPELTHLLADAEPQVQREAVRAILSIGTDSAYQVLQQALASGSQQSRDSIMQALGLLRDERATPLFAYILSHVDHRGPLASIYLRAIESLGTLRDPEAVQPLKTALYRGEWWAPRRTAALRAAAAAALARIGTPDAMEVLREAASSGPRGLRALAKPALQRANRTKD